MLVEIKNLTKRYDQKCALNGIDLNIEEGHIYGLFGPNGSGKTTLIKILANLLMQFHGSVLIDGNELGVETKKIVSYLPDVSYLEGGWTIRESINVFNTFYEDFNKEKATSLMNRFRLDLNDKIRTLSKGNREKVQLILVLSRNAKLFLFDEPIAGVDPAARQIVFDLIKELLPAESTAIITTHLILDIENIVDKVIFINEGKIVLDKDRLELEEEQGGKSINEVFIDMYKDSLMFGGSDNVW